MLTVLDIANDLEKTTAQVHKYIQNKHLIATKTNGKYLIKEEDYDYFFNNYYLLRHKNKGNAGIANENHIKTLFQFAKDCIDCVDSAKNYDEISSKYKHINDFLPPWDSFLLNIRNKYILKDLKSMSQSDVADKYDLSLIAIKKISSKSKESQT